jgi:hypothetical protein
MSKCKNDEIFKKNDFLKEFLKRPRKQKQINKNKKQQGAVTHACKSLLLGK